MSKKAVEENGGMNLGEIGMIRNILMGEQISKYEQRFIDLQEEINSLKGSLLKEIEHNKNRSDSALDRIEEKAQKRLSKMEANMLDGNKKIEEKINQALSENRAQLGEMLIQLGQKLMSS